MYRAGRGKEECIGWKRPEGVYRAEGVREECKGETRSRGICKAEGGHEKCHSASILEWCNVPIHSDEPSASFDEHFIGGLLYF